MNYKLSPASRSARLEAAAIISGLCEFTRHFEMGPVKLGVML